MSPDERAESAVAVELSGERPGRTQDQGRVGPSPAAVPGNDDRAAGGHLRGEEGLDRGHLRPRLIAQDDQHRVEGRVERGQADPDRARQPVLGCRVADHSGPIRSRDRLEAGYSRSRDHDRLGQRGRSNRAQDMVEQRTTGQFGQELATPEPRSSPGRQDQRRGSGRVSHPRLPAGLGGLDWPASRLGALAHRSARAAAAFGDDLGHDRERRLGRRPTAEVEADRTAQLIELGIGQAGGPQPLAPIPCVLREPTAPT